MFNVNFSLVVTPEAQVQKPSDQVKKPPNNRNYVNGGLRLIKISYDDDIYVEDNLGADTELPYFLIPGKESPPPSKVDCSKN